MCPNMAYGVFKIAEVWIIGSNFPLNICLFKSAFGNYFESVINSYKVGVGGNKTIRKFSFFFMFQVQHTIGFGYRGSTHKCHDAVALQCLQSVVGVLLEVAHTIPYLTMPPTIPVQRFLGNFDPENGALAEDFPFTRLHSLASSSSSFLDRRGAKQLSFSQRMRWLIIFYNKIEVWGLKFVLWLKFDY